MSTVQIIARMYQYQRWKLNSVLLQRTFNSRTLVDVYIILYRTCNMLDSISSLCNQPLKTMVALFYEQRKVGNMHKQLTVKFPRLQRRLVENILHLTYHTCLGNIPSSYGCTSWKCLQNERWIKTYLVGHYVVNYVCMYLFAKNITGMCSLM